MVPPSSNRALPSRCAALGATKGAQAYLATGSAAAPKWFQKILDRAKNSLDFAS
jgi:hypothetical protein